jgi:hypothetical protein
MYFKFFIFLVVSAVVFPWVYSILTMPSSSAVVTGLRVQERGFRLLGFFFFAIGFLLSVYVVVGWSAFIATVSSRVASLEEVTHGWVYYLTGLIVWHSPLGVMASKEPPGERGGIVLHMTIGFVALVVFAFWPPTAEFFYGWLTNWLPHAS